MSATVVWRTRKREHLTPPREDSFALSARKRKNDVILSKRNTSGSIISSPKRRRKAGATMAGRNGLSLRPPQSIINL